MRNYADNEFGKAISNAGFSGYDPESGSDIEIEPFAPAGGDGSIEYFDYGEGRVHRVRVIDIRRSASELELRVADNESGELRVLALLA